MTNDTTGDESRNEDAMARLRRNSDRYGKSYAVFGEAFRGQGFTLAVKAVWWFILGMAALAVVMAVLSKF
jgi:hypothetical protein